MGEVSVATTWRGLWFLPTTREEVEENRCGDLKVTRKTGAERIRSKYSMSNSLDLQGKEREKNWRKGKRADRVGDMRLQPPML